MSLVAAILSGLASMAVHAQDDTVVRVDYTLPSSCRPTAPNPSWEADADPLAYPPIVVEMTVFTDTGQRFEVRATSAQRIPPAPDIFTVPDPVP